MTRIAVAILALLAGLLTVPLVAQPAVADTSCPTASVSYAGGAGTSVSPWQISTAGDLQKLRDDSITGWDDSFILTANIDMGGCTWARTIGNNTRAFTGLLDGGGFAVSGLTISVAETTTNAHAGLVGLLASPGRVTRIGFTGSVSSSATTGSTKFSHAGGLVGYAQVGSSVTYSYATGSVNAYVSLGSAFSSAYAYAGGLVGRLDGTVSDSYATGSVSATGGTGEKYMYAGGLIGVSTSSVSRSYSTGSPSATASTFVSLSGGFVGQTNGGTLTGNLWDVTSSGKSNGAGPGTFSGMAGKTTAQMQQFATYDDSSWPITNGWAAFNAPAAVWGICNGSTRAFLLWQYSASPCATAPGAPTITSVSPAATTASVAFSADDSGGAAITRLEFAFDDTTTVDDSTTNVSSPATLSGLNMSTNYTVYMRAVNTQGAGPWSAPVPFRTKGRPSAPVITGVTPDVTAASMAFTADDSGGATILSIQFALDDTTAIDGSSTNVSPIGLTGLTSGRTYTIYIRALNMYGPSPWSAPTSFTTLTPPPPAPIPASAPLDVRATPGDRSVIATWSAPASPGSYPVTIYQATASPGGRSCMATSTTCTIDGLRNGTTYTVTVRALTGAGWSSESASSNAVTPGGDEQASITITGSRGDGLERSRITVSGTAAGLIGQSVRFWVSLDGKRAAESTTRAVVSARGTFTWSRVARSSVAIYAEAAGVRSNTIRLTGVR